MHSLNLWHRLGIVTSLLWIAGAGTWQRNTDEQTANALSFSTYLDCKDRPLPKPTQGSGSVANKCANDMQKAHDLVMDDSWSRVTNIAIVPIFLGWLLAYLVLWVAKWVLAGRTNSN